MVVNNKTSYIAAVVMEENKLIANFAWETTDLLRHENFAPQKFQINTLWALPLLPEIANAIEL